MSFENMVITKHNDYIILNYQKYKIRNSNINELGLYRSVVKKNDEIVCVSPGKALELSDFLDKYQEYKIEEFVEGVMVNCFYDKELDDWQQACYDEINNKHIKELFNNMFDKENWSKLNKKYSYSFVIQDKSLDLATKKREIYLIDVFNKFEVVAKKPELKNVLVPNIYKRPLKEVVEEKCHINSNHLCKGVVLKYKNKRAKILNSSFEYYRYIFNNSSIQKIFEFFYFRKRDFIEKHGINLYNTMKKNYYNLTYGIYITYRNVYIRKTDDISIYETSIQQILNDLHNDYINLLMPSKKYIDKKYTIKKMNNYSHYFKFKLVSSISTFYKILSKLRI